METCPNCKIKFEKNKHNQIYCSKSCSKHVDYVKNSAAYKERARKHRDKDREAWNKQANKYYHSNKERCSVANKNYRINYVASGRNATRKKILYHNNPIIKLHHNVSNSFRKRLMKRISTNEILYNFGYTIDELKIHLESMFIDKMSWENYGKYWSIDHRIPSSWFDKKEINLCWSLDNLQPKIHILNCAKGDFFAEPSEKQLKTPEILLILKKNGFEHKHL